jgi:hypothetical protein
MAIKVTDYQLLDHGIDHAQYFQGCGTAFTDYDEVVTGAGSDFSEAIEQALEQLAMMDYDADDIEARIKEDEDLKEWPTQPNTDEDHEENEESELYYYVSIRVKK